LISFSMMWFFEIDTKRIRWTDQGIKLIILHQNPLSLLLQNLSNNCNILSRFHIKIIKKLLKIRIMYFQFDV
jgi:sulfur relay (sulfurtransferase) DsrF/TusC family protein